MNSRNNIVSRDSIANFYKLHHNKGKSYTYNHFKMSNYGKTQIYAIMKRFDETGGDVTRKSGSGRPSKLTSQQKSQIKRSVNHSAGNSQRKLASKYGVTHRTIGNALKNMGVKPRKRVRAPAKSQAQIQRQADRLVLACGDGSWANSDDPRDIILDDESYFPLNGAQMPGNNIYYTSNPSETPDEIKFRRENKFPEKVMIWAVISSKGIGKIHVFEKRQSMDGELYQEKCLSKVIKFVDDNYESRDDVVFWPDLATCHYTAANLTFMEEAGIYTVPKNLNPPNAPQIRPIENYWGALKQKVYAKNWSAKNREQLIRKIKKCVSELDSGFYVQMFQNLREKINSANENGLDSLL